MAKKEYIKINEDTEFDGETCTKYASDDYCYNRIDFEMDDNDLLLSFYTHGKKVYLHKNDRGEFVVDLANEFKPLRCKNFLQKKVKEILKNVGINFGPHLKAGMIEIKQYLKDNK